ncbi:MAG: sugar phosphate isomerase/epimerase [Methylobacteriaceae bacterium]|nr:sugar phosphate isomerase/epimerase [Methylobacteriaceae bacterium]
MKIGMVSDSLGHLSRDAMFDAAARFGIEGVELNAANWTSAPHLDLKQALANAGERKNVLAAAKRRGIEIMALNANGNQLHPTDGERQSEGLYDTIRLANALGVDTVVCMSGLPEGAKGDKTPNWVVSSWPPETQTILKYQWEDRLLPYWQKLAAFAKENGVRLAVELHGNQLVYNVATLLRLRKEIGAAVGANFDPSHLMWMGADPSAAIDALRGAIHHTHAKDTFINKPVCDVNSRLENGSLVDIPARAWSYITLGFGNGESFWRDFCYRLRLNGYDGWLSIEHEDVMLSREEGVRKSVALLKAVAPAEAADYKPLEL